MQDLHLMCGATESMGLYTCTLVRAVTTSTTEYNGVCVSTDAGHWWGDYNYWTKVTVVQDSASKVARTADAA